MILSDAHRYLFVELPHTGSTAIAQELCERYAGRPVLHKHARLHQFLSRASAEQRRYFVFSGIRNPLDEAVSIYFRYKTDHQRRYSDSRNWKVNGGSVSEYSLARYRFIRDHEADFPTFLERLHTKPYDNWSNLAHHRMDAVLRFEQLQDDFERVLRRLGLAPAASLPRVNRTGERRRAFETYYPPTIREHAARVFGPFMRRWGYAFPPEWGEIEVPMTAQLSFELLRLLRRVRQRLEDRAPRAS